MRVIVEVLGRAYVLQLAQAKIVEPGETDDDEEFKHVPVDPHGTSGCHVERGPGASEFTSDVLVRKIGFSRGSEDASA